MVVSARIKRKTPSADRSLLFLIFGLLAFGVVMVYDATVVYSQNTFGGAYRFVLSQIAWVGLGLVGFTFFYNYHYKNLHKIVFPLSIVTLIPLGLLALAGFLKSFGIMHCSQTSFIPCINGAYRWIYLNPPPLPKIPFFGVLGFQPAEFAKFSLILYLAVSLSKKKNDIPFTYFVISAGLIAGLVLLQPNMSTAMLIFLVASIMYFSSGNSLTPLFVTYPILGVLGLLFMIVSSYRRQRLLTLLGFSEDASLSTGYHINQILIALGSGGFWGMGFGQSRQKYQYLPEVSADSIFAIVGEELGFIGTTVLAAVFCILIYKGYSIAKNAPDILSRLLAVGVTSWIGLQFFINVAAMVKLIPLTGMPIPLISYGGSSMVFSLMGLGILANISKFRRG